MNSEKPWLYHLKNIGKGHREKEPRQECPWLKFKGLAMKWWTYFENLVSLYNSRIRDWNKLWVALRKCHVPYYCERELMHQFQTLQQKDKTIDEYRKEMKLVMLRTGIRKEPMRVIIARFKSGLNLEIRDRVELFPFNYSNDLNELVQQCFRIEQQIRKRTTSREDYPNTSYFRRV